MSDEATDVMLDIETLGVTPGCVILSIGAIEFYRKGGNPVTTFYQAIDRQSCLASGLVEEEKTAEWWKGMKETNPTAYDAAFNDPKAQPLSEVLKDFKVWLSRAQYRAIWAKGPDFDMPILAEAYKRCGMETPWNFRACRCVRTIQDLCPRELRPKYEQLNIPYDPHHPLHDCQLQIAHVHAYFSVKPTEDKGMMRRITENIIAFILVILILKYYYL